MFMLSSFASASASALALALASFTHLRIAPCLVILYVSMIEALLHHMIGVFVHQFVDV